MAGAELPEIPCLPAAAARFNRCRSAAIGGTRDDGALARIADRTATVAGYDQARAQRVA